MQIPPNLKDMTTFISSAESWNMMPRGVSVLRIMYHLRINKTDLPLPIDEGQYVIPCRVTPRVVRLLVCRVQLEVNITRTRCRLNPVHPLRPNDAQLLA